MSAWVLDARCSLTEGDPGLCDRDGGAAGRYRVWARGAGRQPGTASRRPRLSAQGADADTGQVPAANVAVTVFAKFIVTVHWLAVP
jgi:hypothetical protein